jgi:hypothetical protein
LDLVRGEDFVRRFAGGSEIVRLRHYRSCQYTSRTPE